MRTAVFRRGMGREYGRPLCVILLLCLMAMLFAACRSDDPSPADTSGGGIAVTEPSLDAFDGTHEETAADGTPAEEETPGPDENMTDVQTAPATMEDSRVPTDTPETVAPTVTDTETTDAAGEVMTLAPETVPEPDKTAAEMPRLDIVTDGGRAIDSKDYYVHASVSLSGCHENYAFTDVGANLRVRGNSTAVAPKKPYRLKFDVKQEMLGLAGGRAFKNWCLMADYYDGSMLRTYGTFKFAETLMNRTYFSSDCIHVEVYINGKYQGVYLLCEQTQIHKYRINIPETVDGDTSVEQGYLMIGQGGRTDEPGTVVVYPGITVRDRTGKTMTFDAMNFALSGGDYTAEQKEYVSKYVSGVFKVVAHAVYDHEYYSLTRAGSLVRKRGFDWAVTEEEKQIETISAVFNIESAVSMCILDEIVKNLDAMTFNMYVDLSPEGDGILTLAAPWDFDFSMANTHYATTHSYSGFYATNLSVSEGMRTNLWYVMLGSIDWFEEMVKEKWRESYVGLQTVVADMVSVNYAFDAAFDRDFERWGLPIHRSLIHHHDQNDLRTFTDHEYAGNFVTDWLTMRLWWLNTQWGDEADQPPPVEQDDRLVLTFETDSDLILIDGIKRCNVTLTGEGLKLTPDGEARDPYFSFNYDILGKSYDAMLYPYLEFTYRIPKGASAETYVTELFLCTGTIHGPTGGYSTQVTTVADGEWHTVRVDLAATGIWMGTIHQIRFDFFSTCAVGDTMYLKEFKLLTE